MRRLVVAGCACLFAACSQPSPAATPADAATGSTGAGRVAGDSPPPLDPVSLIGTWSFDRTCASEDGMTLAADGTAGTDQGSGMWAVDVSHRLVVIIREQEMGADPDPKAPRQVWTFTATKSIGDDLVGRLDRARPGEPPRPINAKRCS